MYFRVNSYALVETKGDTDGRAGSGVAVEARAKGELRCSGCRWFKRASGLVSSRRTKTAKAQVRGELLSSASASSRAPPSTAKVRAFRHGTERGRSPKDHEVQS